MARIAHSIFFILLTLAFSGCVRPGLTYREYMATSIAPADAKARFIVFRPKDTFLEKLHASARATRVKIDGEVAGYLRGGFKTFEVSAGKHTISVDLWNTPGSCQLEIDTMAGIEYFFQIGQRTEQLIAESVGGLGGQVVDSWANRCSGTFFIEAIQKEVAVTKFAGLKNR